MSWFTRKKQNINKNPKKDLPSDLWIKCPNCGEILYKPELEANNFSVSRGTLAIAKNKVKNK